ncbi:MAG: aspartate/glutamate racemase family protein [Alphaproteobacteria bacterium]|nr:aspartate/glutamate racemase family protein [Alphaproteobacteria bacterium]
MAQSNSLLQADNLLEVDIRNMPYQLDLGMGPRGRIGLIALSGDQTIEAECRRLWALPGVAHYVTRILHYASNVSLETLRRMESGLTDAAALLLPGLRLEVIAFGCTSGSLSIGIHRVHELLREVKPEAKITTPMEAACLALRRLGAGRIAFLSPYKDEINRSMRGYLLEQGFSVPAMASWNISDGAMVNRVSPGSAAEAVREIGRSPGTDAVFVSCTALRVLENIDMLEQEIGKPIVTSNQALAWHCLRLAGVADTVPGSGRLLGLTLDADA